MKQNEISELPRLLPASYENIFNVYKDKDGMYFYNLLQTIIIPDFAPNFYQDYTIKPRDTWPLISYKAYGTTILWWVILHVNKITNPLIQPTPGDIIRILNGRYVASITTAIN
jgi:hypothetical protein